MEAGAWKRRIKSLSLKWKIFLFLLSFSAFLLFILWLFQVVFLERFYQSVKINEAKSCASSIARQIEREDLEAFIDETAINNDVCIEIVSHVGAKLYSADTFRDCIIHKLPPDQISNLIDKAEEKGGEYFEYFGSMPREDRGRNQSIIYVKEITDKSGERLVILINSMILPVNATVNTLRYQLYFITGLMLLVSVGLAFIIAKGVAKPIEKLNESAKILAKGDYNIEFTGKGYREIDELSDTLNITAKELSKVDNLRRELMANISHDLRTPLTLIAGYAEAMNDLPDEMNRENAQIIIDEARRLNTLVNDVLAVSKLESGNMQLFKSTYNLTKSLAEITSRLSEMMKSNGYTITFSYQEEIRIVGDETKISQAFYNLLINAINYTGADKKVLVQQVVEGGAVKIEVIDSGEGISKEALPYIWDRYYKADKNHKRAVMGTGLGLSIVKNIIGLHGGTYGVTTEQEQGSTFWFRLTFTQLSHNEQPYNR